MSFTNFPNGVSSFGMPVAGGGIPPGGNHYWVNGATGAAGNPGTFEAPFAGIAEAFAACTAGQHDTVHYVASGTAQTNLSATLTWNKNYTHLVGHAAPVQTAQRTRIFQASTATGLSPLMNITASGCVFSNFYIFQGVDDATSLINVQVTGGRNFFYRVHFAGGGHATQAIDGGASLKLDGAEENDFVECTIGVDTIDAATGMMGILFDSEAHRNTFYRCTIRMRAGNGGAGFVEIVDATGIDRDNTFDHCRFLNNSGTDMTSGFVIPAGMGAPRKLLCQDCMILGTAKLDANDRGVLFGNMNAVTGADTSGEAVQLIT